MAKRTHKTRRHSFASAFFTLLIVLLSLTGIYKIGDTLHLFPTTQSSQITSNSSGFTSLLPDFITAKLSGKSTASDSIPDSHQLSVTFLDVGQGNCVLAESDGHYMLIDGGDGEHSSFLVSYLTNHQITQLDYVIISHYDADHLSGVIGAMYNIPVETLLSPDYSADTKIYNSYLNCITKQNITPTHPHVGDTFTFGNAAFQIVCPNRLDYEDENNRSLGIRLTDNAHSFLILGDAEKASETDMLKNNLALQSDVLMVSHHGSSSSSSDKFISAVQPKYAVISVGANNKYHHPTDKTLAVLASHNADVYRTDEHGSITFYSNPNELSIVTEK